MSGDIWGSIRDLLVIAYLFALRIGVPILVTLMLGAWLQKLLQQPEAQVAPREYRPGQFCWEYQDCADTKRAQCAAAARPDLPCWLAVQVSGSGVPQECYSCPVFAGGPAAQSARARR